MKRYTTHKLSKREKQNKRIKQLKRELAKTQEELKNINTCRVLARRLLGENRDFFVSAARAQENDDRKRFWLEKVGTINLILSITTSHEEFDREWQGEKVQPYKLDLTDEERALIHQEFEVTKTADDNA